MLRRPRLDALPSETNSHNFFLSVKSIPLKSPSISPLKSASVLDLLNSILVFTSLPLTAEDLKIENRFFPEDSSLVATPPPATVS
ncbi:hypothetical protein LXL04_012735 [Taraxacum kok-saghyz]